MASAINAMARYTLNNMDYRRARSRGGENAPAWENKSIYVSYIDLVTGPCPLQCSPDDCLTPDRLPQIDNLPHILHDHPHILRPPAQYH